MRSPGAGRREGEHITPGEAIAKIPRDTTKVQDITGGLARVAELFEARKPKDHAIISEIDGQVSFGKDTKGKRKVLITPFGIDGSAQPDQSREYLIPNASFLAIVGDGVQRFMFGPAASV